MKTSLRRLRGALHHKHDAKDRRSLLALAQKEELAQASQEMQDMRDCYDGLLSAAAATANSAFEFSESLRDLGSCLLEKTALNDDEESGRVLLMLGKVQFELQKLVDNYRSHIFQTITIPSESLLNELRTVEEMKQLCDEKRNVYEHMLTRLREKGRSKNGKGETFSMQQLQEAHEEYDNEATLFVFRLKSLKQGQTRSLLTQAARHHASQLCFFKKALNSLQEVEPHVKAVTESHHIDYHFSGLDDDNDENDDDDDDDDDTDNNDGGSEAHDDGELSFDYRVNDKDQDAVSAEPFSSELGHSDITFPHLKENTEPSNQKPHSAEAEVRHVSQSAPLSAENRSYSRSEKLLQMRSSFTRRFNTYVLPTPSETRTPRATNSNTSPSPLPSPPTLDRPLSSRLSQPSSDTKRLKRRSFSGPITTKPFPINRPELFSGPIIGNPPRPHKLPSSPKISELHELPRPPNTSSPFKSPRAYGHSAPLIPKIRLLPTGHNNNNNKAVTALLPQPPPPMMITRSFSIPTSRLKDEFHNTASPPLTPMSLLSPHGSCGEVRMKLDGDKK